MGSTLTVIAAVISVIGAVVTVLLGARFERRRHLEQRQQTRLDRTDRYSGPLLSAASALASRLRNGIDPGQIGEFVSGRPAHERQRYLDYALNETLYRIGRYLCWAHIVSQEIRVLDLGNEKRNRDLVRSLAAVQGAVNNREGDRTFMLLGGEQRALGEVMIDPDREEADCISYIRFVDRLEDPRFARWFEPLKRDLSTHLEHPDRTEPRIRAITEALDDLIAILDPNDIWVPFGDD